MSFDVGGPEDIHDHSSDKVGTVDYDWKPNNEDVVRQLVFETVDDAEKLYTSYADLAGFEIRKQCVKRKKDGIIKYREWMCTCEGFCRRSGDDFSRKREARVVTRCGCNAGFRVAHDRFKGHYIVTKFESKHNHDLQGSKKRNISVEDKSILSVMTDVGFRPCQVMDLLEQLAGGAGNMSFTRKDGYNFLNKVRLERIEGGDVKTLLDLFSRMKMKDDGFFYRYTVNEEGSLSRIFWSDGASRAEYKLFGDVVVFDSTYKTNTYLYPLVIFSGINNHGTTCIFGAAFMYNETIESYRWLLQVFLEANGKIPGSVVTDQDSSMIVAVRSEFPGTKHRLCSWHIARNIRQHIKVPEFCDDFMRVLREPYSIDEFELAWANIVEGYEVAQEQWVIDMYQIKEMSAKAYFRGHFMAMTRTTQRAESMNAVVKLSANQRMSTTDFVKQYGRTLQKIRSDFIALQTHSEKSKPAVRDSPLKKFEEHAASICSKKIFQLIREEIKEEQGLLVKQQIQIRDGQYLFGFLKYNKLDGPQYSVNIDMSRANFKCNCLKLESKGVPCRHIISSLKLLQMTRFPDGSIHPRWIIDSGRILKSKAHNSIGADRNSYVEISKDPPVNTRSNNVSYPKRIKTRGASRAKQQNCSLCGKPGHKVNTCVLNPRTANRRKNTRLKKSRTEEKTSNTQEEYNPNPHMKDAVQAETGVGLGSTYKTGVGLSPGEIGSSNEQGPISLG